jgi:medium-chain acyl-[acyl-carrier-protein] hydrolase
LIIAALTAPQSLPMPPPELSRLPQAEFVERVRSLGGIPELVLQQPELFQQLIPLLLGDAALFESYRYREKPRLACPISVLGGHNDAVATVEQLERWRELSSGSFSMHIIGSGHFFPHTERKRVVACVERELRPLSAAGAARASARSSQ